MCYSAGGDDIGGQGKVLCNSAIVEAMHTNKGTVRSTASLTSIEPFAKQGHLVTLIGGK